MGQETAKRVLVVDDEAEFRSLVCDALRMEGYATSEASDGAEAVRSFRSDLPDAVLLDLQMPRQAGLPTLREMRAIAPDVPVIILSGHGDIAAAVGAVKGGACDYIEKPADFERVSLSLRQALEKRRLEGEVRRISAALDTSLEGRFGTSPAIRTVIGRMKQVAPTDLAVIVQGETGTGKTYVARAIHELSRRAAGPFVRVDVSVVPPTLAESELFGSRKGAYTGSDKDRAGYVAAANGGTLFLDDIENTPLDIQAKLLDVLETKRICPVGGGEPIGLDFRVVAATNRDLRACVAARAFREDLLYRLGEFVVDLPPLRERPEDILFFMDLFLEEACGEMGRQVHGFSAAAADLLLSHPWPGNVRELKNVIRRAILLAPGELVETGQIDFLSRAVPGPEECAAAPLKEAVQELERKLIRKALEKTGGNKTRAAELLKVSYPTLLGKVRDYGLEE
ncbi:MAG TPA: sigma-54 dependent transcriptional regulator [Candidatus Methanoperedens sp.]|nr:sigma-54 dependent transcriptional regulator [Candidatus Methanoperedens sp.]